MEHVTREDASNWLGPSTERRPLGRALGTERLAINYYELAPGETVGFGYHKHDDQEEVFYVIEGTATFETADGDVDVAADEAIRFAPGEWQLGRNDGDETLVLLGLGAPADSGGADMRRECPDCGERTPNRIESAEDGQAVVTVCEACGAETGRYR